MGLTPMPSLLMAAFAGPVAEADRADVAILEATIRCLSHHGLERMTVADVAAEAGVGRATVFRRFDTKDELVRRALALELSRIVDDFRAATESIDDPVERSIEWTVKSVQVVRTHPVARRLVDDNAALGLLRDPQIMALVLAAVGHELETTAERIGVTVDVATAAEVMVRFFGSVWLTPNLGSATATDDGVRRIARTVLSFLTVADTPGSDR